MINSRFRLLRLTRSMVTCPMETCAGPSHTALDVGRVSLSWLRLVPKMADDRTCVPEPLASGLIREAGKTDRSEQPEPAVEHGGAFTWLLRSVNLVRGSIRPVHVLPVQACNHDAPGKHGTLAGSTRGRRPRYPDHKPLHIPAMNKSMCYARSIVALSRLFLAL